MASVEKKELSLIKSVEGAIKELDRGHELALSLLHLLSAASAHGDRELEAERRDLAKQVLSAFSVAVSHLKYCRTRREADQAASTPHGDGYRWRKYGQKKIHNSNHPRSYYRCAYREDMNCKAMKQVQLKDSEEPHVYTVIYTWHHTCGTMLEAFPELEISPSSARDTFLISFESNPEDTAKLNPMFSSSSTLSRSGGLRTDDDEQVYSSSSLPVVVADHGMGEEKDLLEFEFDTDELDQCLSWFESLI
ncbi:putative WRKY transcription factor 38 [Apostasia shenzhenica]|uniref:Putative WRKY transcription factor 38 n=1 Tax=Apostasia shenzhenica TaxID=1088818 RepID=A0A2I0A4T2_9ASPA|nr:putative WRKY transcription factor 38 [Apostasia shenzhenica]